MSIRKSKALSRVRYNELLQQFSTMRRDNTRTLNSDLILQYGEGTDDAIVIPAGSTLTAMPSRVRSEGPRVMMRFETDTQWVDVLDNACIVTRRKRSAGEPSRQVQPRSRTRKKATRSRPIK